MQIKLARNAISGELRLKNFLGEHISGFPAFVNYWILKLHDYTGSLQPPVLSSFRRSELISSPESTTFLHHWVSIALHLQRLLLYDIFAHSITSYCYNYSNYHNVKLTWGRDVLHTIPSADSVLNTSCSVNTAALATVTRSLALAEMVYQMRAEKLYTPFLIFS